MNAEADRVSQLHLLLIDELDDLRRARFHLELAVIAVRDGQLDSAACHFREALHFDHTLELARKGLHELGELVREAPERCGFFGALINRLKRKANV